MITIDYQDRSPIYLQLITKIEELVAKGYLAPNDKLPTVRNLAMELSINPNTIQRAYGELERKGVIYTVTGKGSFISPATGDLLARKRLELFGRLKNQIIEAKTMGISEDEFVAECHKLYASSEKEAMK